MSLSTLEQNLLNLVDSLTKVGAQLVAANNPAYANLIPLATGTIDEINAKLNPGAAAAVTTINQAATDITAGIVPGTQAVEALTSKTATATEKASAVGTLLGTIETIGGDVISFFHHPSPTSATQPPTPAVTVTPAAS